MTLVGENLKANVACLTCAVVAAGVEYTPTVNGFWKPAPQRKLTTLTATGDNGDDDDDEDELKRLFLLVSARGP